MPYNTVVEILIARSAYEIDAAFDRLSMAETLGCDTETSSLSARYGRLYSVQFSDGDFNVLVPVSENVPLGRLAEILESPSITKIFHNAKFDLEFLRENGYLVQNVFDTMIAEKVLTKGANQSASLAETLYRYFAVDLDKSQRAKFTKTWDGIWTDELVNYALSDVAHLPNLMREQAAWIERLGLRDIYLEQVGKILLANNAKKRE
jgi:DNA polymerase-1